MMHDVLKSAKQKWDCKYMVAFCKYVSLTTMAVLRSWASGRLGPVGALQLQEACELGNFVSVGWELCHLRSLRNLLKYFDLRSLSAIGYIRFQEPYSWQQFDKRRPQKLCSVGVLIMWKALELQISKSCEFWRHENLKSANFG